MHKRRRKQILNMMQIYIISVPKASRLRTPMYLIHLGLLVPYLALFVLQIVYRIQMVAEEYPYHCTIGFQLPASVTTLAYDILLSLLYTGFFVKYAFYPSVAQQTAHQAVSLRIIAQRSIVASTMAIFASAINYCVLIGLDGQMRGLLETSIISIVSIMFLFYSSHRNTDDRYYRLVRSSLLVCIGVNH